MSGPILLPFPGAATGERPYFGRIDALRGIGALAVAAYHVSGHGIHGRSFLPVDTGSWDGVSAFERGVGQFVFRLLPAHAALMMFFVVSGFVLRLAFDRGPEAFGPSLGRFLVARVFRFFPITFAATTFGVALACADLPHDATFDHVTFTQFVSQVFLIDTAPISVLWALQVEVLMIPVLFVLWRLERRWGPATVVAVAAGLLIFLAKPSWAPSRALGINAFAFTLGATIPTVGRAWARRISPRTAAGATIGLAATLILSHPVFGLFSRFGTLIEGVSAWLFVSLMAYRTDVSWLRVFDSKILVRIGTWAGSVYVLHMLTIPLGLAGISAVVPPTAAAASPLVTGLVGMAVWLAGVVGLAAVGYRLVESPGMRAGARVNRLLGWVVKQSAIPARVPMPLRKAA